MPYKIQIRKTKKSKWRYITYYSFLTLKKLNHDSYKHKAMSQFDNLSNWLLIRNTKEKILLNPNNPDKIVCIIVPEK